MVLSREAAALSFLTGAIPPGTVHRLTARAAAAAGSGRRGGHRLPPPRRRQPGWRRRHPQRGCPGPRLPPAQRSAAQGSGA